VQRCCCHQAYAPMSNTASHFYHEESDAQVSMSMGLCTCSPNRSTIIFIETKKKRKKKPAQFNEKSMHGIDELKM